MPGGALFFDDWYALRDSVRRVIGRFAYTAPCIRFVEVGIGLGDGIGKTSADLMLEIDKEMRELGVEPDFTYYGVDAFTDYPGINDKRFVFINRPSHTAIDNLPSNINWCMIDSCHCYSCVKRDLLVYLPLIAVSGEICFHDASPQGQGREPQDIYAGDHDPAIAAEGIAVRRVLDEIMPTRHDFRLISRAPLDQPLGGVEIYRRIHAA